MQRKSKKKKKNSSYGVSTIKISNGSIKKKHRLHFTSLQKIVLFKLPRRITWKIIWETFHIDQETLPNKIRNLESFKKNHKQLKISLANVLAVRQNLLRAYCKLYYLQFCVLKDERTYCSNDFTCYLRELQYQNNVNLNSCRFSCKLIFNPFFRMKQKWKATF